jgi:hypothetical protein
MRLRTTQTSTALRPQVRLVLLRGHDTRDSPSTRLGYLAQLFQRDVPRLVLLLFNWFLVFAIVLYGSIHGSIDRTPNQGSRCRYLSLKRYLLLLTYCISPFTLKGYCLSRSGPCAGDLGLPIQQLDLEHLIEERTGG